MKQVQATLGTGSAHTGDRLPPALDLASSGLVQYLVFDRLGGPAVAHLELARREDPDLGHDPETTEVARRFAPYMSAGVRLIGSFGAANVAAGLAAAVDGIRDAGTGGLRVAGIHGDNVRDLVVKHDAQFPKLECRASDLGDDLLTAHAYIGADLVSAALDQGCHFVLGGRICDASLAVGAIRHGLGWEDDDWDALASATLVGHLLTGGAGAVGGGFADPPYRTVPGIEDLGFPMARVDRDGFVVSKLAEAGGLVSPEVLKCRISYEIHDPSAYLTPDVTADFTMAAVDRVGENEVRVSGIRGRPRPPALLVLAAIDRGWIGSAEVSYGGPGCLDRARLGEEMARKCLDKLGSDVDEVWVEYFGLNALHRGNYVTGEPADVRLRVAARTSTIEAAEEVRGLAMRLYWGPAGTGVMSGGVTRAIESTDAFLPRDLVDLEMEVADA